MLHNIVCPHCGSAHVKGIAKNYPYFVCSLFKIRKRKRDGKLIYYNSGISTYPRRGYQKCCRDGITLAQKYDAKFDNNYGSLHNKLVNNDN